MGAAKGDYLIVKTRPALPAGAEASEGKGELLRRDLISCFPSPRWWAGKGGEIDLLGRLHPGHLADRHRDTVFAVHTHTQRAQPTTVAHYLLAVIEQLDATPLLFPGDRAIVDAHLNLCVELAR